MNRRRSTNRRGTAVMNPVLLLMLAASTVAVPVLLAARCQSNEDCTYANEYCGPDGVCHPRVNATKSCEQESDCRKGQCCRFFPTPSPAPGQCENCDNVTIQTIIRGSESGSLGVDDWLPCHADKDCSKTGRMCCIASSMAPDLSRCCTKRHCKATYNPYAGQINVCEDPN